MSSRIISNEALQYLRQRLENRAFAISHKLLPLKYATMTATDGKYIYITEPKALTEDTI